MGDEVVGLVLKVGGLRVVGVEVVEGGDVGVWWERCVEDGCGVGRWVVVVVVVVGIDGSLLVLIILQHLF